MSLQARSRAVPEPQFSTLPGRFQRSDVERIITVASAALGLSSARLRALLVMMQATRPSDWTTPDSDAVCYMQQMMVAARLGITTRALRNHEAGLERAGLIRRDVGADGSRGRYAGGELVQGISFEPMIAAFPRLVAIAEAREAEDRACQVFRRKCSAARRVLKRAISALMERNPKHSALSRLLVVYAETRGRYDGLSLDVLRETFKAVDKAAKQAVGLLEMQPDSSGVPEEDFRLHIQDTTHKNLESCSASDANTRPARKRADNNSFGPAPEGAGHCLENKDALSSRGHKPGYLETFTPRQLYRMASDDMRMYLDAQTGGDRTPTEHDFIQASISLLPALGVHPSAWDEAAAAMGDLAAALCVIVVDANRFRPVAPVRKPGAMLRSMTRLAEQGGLNLIGSLIGLKQRTMASPGEP